MNVVRALVAFASSALVPPVWALISFRSYPLDAVAFVSLGIQYLSALYMALAVGFPALYFATRFKVRVVLTAPVLGTGAGVLAHQLIYSQIGSQETLHQFALQGLLASLVATAIYLVPSRKGSHP